ncbi:MAG: flavin reductase family protein [Ruminococcus flavefaciens]
MKISIDTKLALYTAPVTVIGTMNGDKPTWTLVAHIGIIGHDRILVSLAEPHYINHLIKENGRLSINLATEEMLPAADVSGSVTGAKDDKSDLFEYELGQRKSTPLPRNITPCLQMILQQHWLTLSKTMNSY